jgi:hypothetical protein
MMNDQVLSAHANSPSLPGFGTAFYMIFVPPERERERERERMKQKSLSCFITSIMVGRVIFQKYLVSLYSPA